jgi:hypothetical protein
MVGARMKTERAMKLAMKMFALAVLTLCACGGGGKCASPYAGDWIGTTAPDRLSLSDSCDFNYQGSDGCKSHGTYAAPLGASGSVAVAIQSTTGGRCLLAGNYTCVYSASSSALTFDCGAGAFGYRR